MSSVLVVRVWVAIVDGSAIVPCHSVPVDGGGGS